jgi:hypothetical protein
MQTALDFVIDVFSTTPMSKEEIDAAYCFDRAIESQLDYPKGGTENDMEQGDWVAVLYNDEVHSYNDVIGQLGRIDRRRYTREVAMVIASLIDSIGRAPIARDEDIHAVVKKAQLVMRVGLFCSVRTERDFLRECVAGYILEWLMDCISVGVSVGGDEMILRDILCQTLASKWDNGVREPDWRIELEGPEDNERDSWGVMDPLVLEGPVEERWAQGDYVRLDWILFFDARLWKSLRKCVKSIILGCLLGGKAELAGGSTDIWRTRNWKRITGTTEQSEGG